MSFSIVDVLLMIGVTHGLVGASMLFFAREKCISNKLLGLAILSFCLMFIKVLLIFTGLSATPTFRYLPNAFELATAPLFYLYLRALTEKDFHWQPRMLLHFTPCGIAYAYALFIFTMAYGQPTTDLQDQAAHQYFYYEFKEFEDWSIVTSIFSYLVLGYQRFIAFQRRVRNHTADTAYPTLNWLRSILVLCIILWLYLVFNMLESRFALFEVNRQLHWQIYYIYVAGFTYYLGVMSYRQQAPDLSQIYPNESESNPSEIADNDTQQLLQRLQQLIEQEQIYLEPTLNVRQVADRLEVNQTSLSQLINRHFDKSFRELINHYRIEDVKTKLLDSQNKASILSLALESGFNSEASFYRVFKNSTGLTPKAFIEQHS